MVRLDEITLKRVRGGAHLTDIAEGFGEELLKLKAIANMISSVSTTGNPLDFKETRQGLYYGLADIATRIEEGLEHLDEQIKADKPAIQSAEEAIKCIDEGPPSMQESAKAELELAARLIVNEITRLMVVKERCQLRLAELKREFAT